MLNDQHLLRWFSSTFLFVTILLYAYALVAQPQIHQISLTPNPVGKYEKLELSVNITANYTNPFNPDDIRVWALFTSPSSEEWQVNGFWDGSNWKIRFSADETGIWSYIV